MSIFSKLLLKISDYDCLSDTFETKSELICYISPEVDAHFRYYYYCYYYYYFNYDDDDDDDDDDD